MTSTRTEVDEEEVLAPEQIPPEVPATLPPDEGDEAASTVPVARLALVVIFPLLSAATLAGGAFVGMSARFHAAIAAILGVGVAVVVIRITRPLLTNVLAVAGLF